MRKRNKLLLLILSVVFAFTMFALAACGDSEEGDKKTEVGISLNPKSLSLVEGGATGTITATVTGTKDAVKWSVDNNTIATITFSGKTCTVTPKKEGSTTVRAIVGKKAAACTVTVGAAETPQASLTLDEAELDLVVDGTPGTLTATATNIDTEETPLEWSVDKTDVVSLSGSGNSRTVTAIGKGTATVTVKAGDDITASCTVNVTLPTPEVELDEAKLDLVVGGTPGTLTANVKYADGQTTEWSIDKTDVATISHEGNVATVTAVGEGTAIVTAKVGDTEAHATINVTVPPVTIDLDKEAVTLKKGETPLEGANVVTATVANSEENVIWTVGSEKIATVAASGEQNEIATITAVAAGSTTLTAAIGDVKKQITINVQPAEGETVEVTVEIHETAPLVLETGDEHEVSVTVVGSVATPAWTVDDNTVVSIAAPATGSSVNITALKAGTAVLTVTVGEGAEAKTATLNITVNDPVTITLDKEEVTLVNEEGDNKSATVTATVTGPTEKVTWAVTAGEEYITVAGTDTNTITITAQAAGTATITATIGEVVKTVTVTVNAPVTLSIDNTTLTLTAEGEAGTITATVTGTEDAISHEVTGDTDAVEITRAGNVLTVTPLKAGTATITVSVGGKTAECVVTVNAKQETTIPHYAADSTAWQKVDDAINGAATDPDGDKIYHHVYIITEEAFDAYEVTATVDGKDAKVLNKGALYGDLAYNNYHAQIRIMGNEYADTVLNFTFTKDGETVATATYERKGTKKIELNKNETQIVVGDTDTITANVLGNIADKTVTWTVDKEGIVTLPETTTGESIVVTAAAKGTVTLTATVGEGASAITAECAITVNEEFVAPTIHEVKNYDAGSTIYGAPEEIHHFWFFLNAQDDADMPSTQDKLDAKKDTGVELVNITVNGTDVTSAAEVIQYEVVPNCIHIHVKVPGGTKDNATSIEYNLKDKSGYTIVHGTYVKEPPKSLTVASRLEIQLGEGGAAQTADVTATTTGIGVNAEEIVWTIDGDGTIATIPENSTGATVTVTGKAVGEVTLTATLVVDEKTTFTKICTVVVFTEGDKPVVELYVIPAANIHDANDIYGGDGNVHVHFYIALDAERKELIDISKTKVDKVTFNGADITAVYDGAPPSSVDAGNNYHIHVKVGDGTTKLDDIKGGKIEITLTFYDASGTAVAKATFTRG